EQAREKIRAHFNAKFTREIIFTSGTTDGINLVAHGFSSFLKKGDELIVSALEHHSNIVPWQMLCEATGATLKVIPINDQGILEMEDRKSTRLNSSHVKISYAVFCLKKKTKQ